MTAKPGFLQKLIGLLKRWTRGANAGRARNDDKCERGVFAI